MIGKIRNRILAFINSPADVPLLSGISVGFYMLLFYYATNYSLASSWQQLAVIAAYYVVLPAVCLFAGYKLLGATKFYGYQRNFLFAGMTIFFMFFLLELTDIGFSKKIAMLLAVLVAAALSFKIKQYYKLFIVLLFLMSFFNIYTLVNIIYVTETASGSWKDQPDAIEKIAFKSRPNIYYIQPDGYANPANLESSVYNNFDNSDFNNFLNNTGFKTYRDFRSNYYSTLLSNSSMFAMKHHFTPAYMDPYGARDVIISDNPVLRILKNNRYKTHFFTERPYLIINRPGMGYDYCNFTYGELPYFMDGWEMYRDVFPGLKEKVDSNTKSGNFYFIEAFSPGHIANSAAHSQGVTGERINYLNRIKEANVFLRKVVSYINEKDPDGIIIIAADHGGFAGFEHLDHALKLTDDEKLVNSMFGAHLSIKWNGPQYQKYDVNLRSSVNLFRTVFSYLAQDNKYLKGLQDNSSYVRLTQPNELYRYIDDSGYIVLEKYTK